MATYSFDFYNTGQIPKFSFEWPIAKMHAWLSRMREIGIDPAQKIMQDVLYDAARDSDNFKAWQIGDKVYRASQDGKVQEFSVQNPNWSNINPENKVDILRQGGFPTSDVRQEGNVVYAFDTHVSDFGKSNIEAYDPSWVDKKKVSWGEFIR